MKKDLVPEDLDGRLMDSEIDDEFLVMRQESCFGEDYLDVWIMSLLGKAGDAERVFMEALC